MRGQILLPPRAASHRVLRGDEPPCPRHSSSDELDRERGTARGTTVLPDFIKQQLETSTCPAQRGGPALGAGSTARPLLQPRGRSRPTSAGLRELAAPPARPQRRPSPPVGQPGRSPRPAAPKRGCPVGRGDAEASPPQPPSSLSSRPAGPRGSRTRGGRARAPATRPPCRGQTPALAP